MNVNLRYCEKCDKCFDNDCYFCSYCGSKLDYRDDIEPEGFWKSLAMSQQTVDK